MKKLLKYGLVSIMATSLVACSSKSPEVTPNQSTDSQNTPISFWHHMEGPTAVALEEVCKTFNETVGAEYGIVVTPSFQGSNTAEKLNTLAQAGDWANFPDVVQVASAGIPAISEYDMFVSPEEMYAKGQDIIVERDSIIENNARTFTYNDELSAMPFSNSTILLYYNKDLFKEAGLDPEMPPATIAEMADAIEKLTVKNGNEVETYGLEVQVKRYQLFNWIGGQGEYNFIGDNEGGRTGLMSKVTFDEDGSLMNFLNEWEKVIQTGGYKAVEDNLNEEFAMELTGMAIMSSARIGKLEGLIGDNFEWAAAPFPKVNATDEGGTAIGGSGVVMFDHGNEDQTRAAWIFQQYLAGPEAQYDFCTASGYIPVNKDLYETDKMKAYLEENKNIKVAVEQLAASHPNVQEPFDMVTSEINGIIDEEMIAFAKGAQDKQTTHDNIVAKCNEKLQNYVRVNGN